MVFSLFHRNLQRRMGLGARCAVAISELIEPKKSAYLNSISTIKSMRI